MTIRTNSDHEKLNGHSLVYSKYLPIELAYALPAIFEAAGGKDLNDKAQREESMKKVSEFLDKSECAVCIGFGKNGADKHRCKIDFCDNLRTFGEEKEGINGKPSIGIQFVDADDSYNDWIWIATDVLMGFHYETELSRARMIDYVNSAAKFFGVKIINKHFMLCKDCAKKKEEQYINITDFSGGKSFISLTVAGLMEYTLVNEKAKILEDKYLNLTYPSFKKFAVPQKIVLNPANILKVTSVLAPMKRLVYSESKCFFGLCKKRIFDVETYGTEAVTKVVISDKEVFYVKETIQEIDERIFQMKMCGFKDSSVSDNSTVDASDTTSEQTDSCEPPPSAKE